MNAIKCDRCGKFYIPKHRAANGYPFSKELLRIIPNNGGGCERVTIQVCDGCFHSFECWLIDVEVTNNDET